MRDIKVMNNGSMVAKVDSIPMALVLIDKGFGQVMTVNGRRIWNTTRDTAPTPLDRSIAIAQRLNAIQKEHEAKHVATFASR